MPTDVFVGDNYLSNYEEIAILREENINLLATCNELALMKLQVNLWNKRPQLRKMFLLISLGNSNDDT